MDAKEIAARKAASYVRDGMTLGLGTGRTAALAIHAIGERVNSEGLKVRGIPTSDASRKLAMEVGIELIELTACRSIDMTIDGADEVNPELDLIKGGGGALVREKIVAAASRELIIVCDDAKVCSTLGAFPLPIAVIPFGWEATRDHLVKVCDTIVRRSMNEDPGAPFITDDGLVVLDLHMGRIDDAPMLDRKLRSIPGVAETGLFIGMAARVIVGYPDGRCEEHIRPERGAAQGF